MRITATIVLFLIGLSLSAQNGISATDSFVIKGAVKNELTFNSADLEKYQPKAIDEVSLEHYRQASGTSVNQMKGILLKDLLRGQQYVVNSPQDKDKLKLYLKNAKNQIVFTWDELFNQEVGDKTYLITSMNGQTFKGVEGRILLITPPDLNTGRKYIKNLSEIEIKK